MRPHLMSLLFGGWRKNRWRSSVFEVRRRSKDKFYTPVRKCIRAVRKWKCLNCSQELWAIWQTCTGISPSDLCAQIWRNLEDRPHVHYTLCPLGQTHQNIMPLLSSSTPVMPFQKIKWKHTGPSSVLLVKASNVAHSLGKQMDCANSLNGGT